MYRLCVLCIASVKEVHLIGVGLDTHWKRSHVWYMSGLHTPFIVIVLHLVVTMNVMFAAAHSLHTDGSPYMIFTNQIGVGLHHERDHHT